jgi:hypothetical protein
MKTLFVNLSNKIVNNFYFNSKGQKMNKLNSNGLIFILYDIVKDKSLKNWNYFHQFTFEILLETLKTFEFNEFNPRLAFFMIENSSEKQNEEMIDSMLKNKHDFNTAMVILFGLIFKKLSESQSLAILSKLGAMKENILKIEQSELKTFLQQVSFTPNSSNTLARFF